jgi:WD40 repeat protein
MEGPESAGTELPPRQLGEFVLRERIASGGQGELYRAEQPALGRDAVVKILRLPPDGVEELRARFLREAHIASRLDHPYAAHVYAFGAEGDTLWIAMELVRGTSMADYLATAGPMPVGRLVPVFDRLTQVVHSAHEQGIIHRDIKPANVMMVSRAGRLLPKLLDLGIARLADAPILEKVDELTELSTTVAAIAAPANVTGHRDSHLGTPQYMAPEQWVDPRRADARTDVYALGVLCYEMLTGRRPFDGATLMEVARAHARKPVPALGDGFPAEIDAVLTRAMAKAPADRFATPLELAEALRRAAHVDDEDQLPQLPAELRELSLTLAPAPIAEAVSLIEAARNPRQLCAALGAAARTAARYLGAVALAGRAHVGSGTERDEPEAAALLRQLRADGLDAAEWLALARALVRPFAELAEVHAAPPLVGLLADGATGDLAAIDEEMTAGAGEEDRERRARAERVLPRLARALTALTPLYDYRLAVRKGDRIELWVGARRAGRPTVHAPADAPESGVLLLDGEGRVTLPLHPVLQALAPSPGAPEELFFLDGRGRFGARLVAYPMPFERFDDALWPGLEAAIPPLALAVQEEAASEATPYRGLAPFTAADADAFVGREREIEAFGNRLRTQGLIAVVGPSGAGKSSFVQAGVLANLPGDWRSVVLRPGADPIAALASRLGIASAGDLGAEIRRTARSAGGVLVVVVDQFEEVFTLCDDPAARHRFAEALVAATGEDDGAVRVIVTLRDDFLVRAQMLEPLRPRLARGLELLTTPGRADLLRILIEPARRSGYEFEDPELPAEMVDAVEDLVGALPLLSFTASRLWELRDRRLRRLTRRAYEGLGGVGGALGKHAEATLEALSPEHQALVREGFRHLVTSAGTRAVMSRRDLGQILGPQADEVLERLIAARLLVGTEGDAGEEQVEIIHEALLASWPRLVAWRGEDAEHARMREQLRSAARQWKERGQPSGLLWRGDALAEFRAWRARSAGRLTEIEERFAAASAAIERRARRLRRTLVAAVLVASLISTVVFAGLRGRAQASAREAQARVIALYQEQGRQELLAGRPARAAAYLSAAYSAGGDRGAVRFLLGRSLAGLGSEKAVLRHGGGILRVVALSGDRIVTGDEQGVVKLWSIDGALRGELRGHTGPITTAAFDRRGATLVTGGQDGVAIAWDPVSGRQLARLEVGATVRAARWSAAWVAVGARTGAVLLWDPAGDRIVAQLAADEGGLTWLGLAPAGDLIAAGSSGGGLRLWRPPDAAPFAALEAHTGAIWAGAFSPDGEILVTAGDDRTAAVWQLPGASLRTRLSGHADAILTVDLSSDGARLVTGSEDGTARIWDLAEGRMLRVLSGHASYVRFSAFLAGDRRIATASLDGTLRLWDPASGAALALVHTHPGEIWTAALSGDRSMLVTAGFDGTSRVFAPGDGALLREWPAADVASVDLAVGDAIAIAVGNQTQRLGAGPATEISSHRGRVNSIRSAPDGAVVTASEDGTARIIDRGGRPIGELRQDEPIYRAVFSPDGQRIATTSPSGSARLWRRDGREVCRFTGHRDAVWGIAFSRDGRSVATASDDRTARLWRASDCAPLRTFTLPARVNAVDFEPDGRALLVGLESGEMSILAIDDGHQLAHLEGHGDILSALALSPDGRRIASAAVDGTLSVWDGRSGALLHTMAAHPGPITDVAFSADGARVITAGIGGVRLWRFDLETRSPAEVARLMACRMPFLLERDAVVSAPPERCTD